MKRKCIFFSLLLMFSVGLVLAQDPSKDGPHSTCQFHRAGDHFVGSCGPLFDQDPEMTLRSTASISTGVWRNDIQPLSVWSGDMTDRGYPNAPLELEIYADNWGVLRTEYGWFPVEGFVAGSTLSFDLDSSHQVKPGALDLEVVQKASEILSTEKAWNRADNRKCPTNATTWSIYCALERAEVEVTGGAHHRRPASEIVRKIVEERTATRGYHHHLMEYNNDPTTHLRDVQTLFKEAQSEMRSFNNAGNNSGIETRGERTP
jgi:hypothetical protein